MEWAFENKFNRHSLPPLPLIINFIPIFPLDALHFITLEQDRDQARACAKRSLEDLRPTEH